MEIPSSHGRRRQGDEGQGRRQGQAKGRCVLVLEGEARLLRPAAAAPAAARPLGAGARGAAAARRRRRRHPARARSRRPAAARRGRRARHRRLQGCRGDRGAGQARRHGQGRAEPDHRRERQGVDGDPVVARPACVKELQGQGRRQGQHGQPDRGARRQRRRAPPPAAGRRRAAAGRAPAPQRRGTGAGAPAPSAGDASALPTAALPPHEPTAPTGTLPHASPSMRKLARELGVPLDEVKGSGPKGRITQEDVQGFVKAVMSRRGADRGAGGQGAAPAAAAAARPGPAAVAEGRLREVRPDRAQGPVAHQEDQRRQPASQLGDDPARHQPRRRRHHRPRGVPRLDQQGEREVGRQGDDARLPDQGVRRGAEEVPGVQRLLDGEQLVLKQYFHIGFAADTPNGLVVPVHQGRRQEGHPADLAGDGRARQEGARRQARARPT